MKVLVATLPLGKTELTVTRLALGGVQLARMSTDEADRVVHTALDLGVKLLNGSISTVPEEPDESDFDDYGQFNLWARQFADVLELWDPINILS